ncbi:MAG: 50S ribosomal protein L2 [Nanobdellota archaeon]
MGKRLIQQARGKGGPTYRAPSFRYGGEVGYTLPHEETLTGQVVDIVKSAGHSSPLVRVEYANGESSLQVSAEHIKVGDEVGMGSEAQVRKGNVLPLDNIPEGTLVFNIEGRPGDGGKFVRSTGGAAKVVAQMKDKVVVELPSKKKKEFNRECRATIGSIAGSGRKDKPLVKAGKNYYLHKAKNKLWPKVSGNAQNAVDHPFGNSRSLRKSKATPAPRNAPPGRKVGMIRARHTGRNK